MKKSEFLLDTDILLDHLYHKTSSPSTLEILMTKGICFTTAINAAQLIFEVPEKSIILDLLNAIKVLGIHPRYSLIVNKYRDKLSNTDDALFCASAEINKLPIVCLDKAKYISTGLSVLIPEEIIK